MTDTYWGENPTASMDGGESLSPSVWKPAANVLRTCGETSLTGIRKGSMQKGCHYFHQLESWLLVYRGPEVKVKEVSDQYCHWNAWKNKQTNKKTNIHEFMFTLPLLVLTILTVESSDPVATSTLSLFASMHVIDPWWAVPSADKYFSSC